MITKDSLIEVRSDGKAIVETMPLDDLMAWEPCKVLSMKWDCNGKSIELKSDFGLSSVILPSRKFIAVLEETDESGDHCSLKVYDAEGRVVREFSKETPDGSIEFDWFEDLENSSGDYFGVTFHWSDSSAIYLARLDAMTGAMEDLGEFR